MGSGQYELKDSYFAIIHPFTYVIIGIVGLIVVIIFLKKRKR